MSTKIQLISDIHQYSNRVIFHPENVLPDSDCLVLAGDLYSPGRLMFQWLKPIVDTHPRLPIFIILGNHEYYGGLFPYDCHASFLKLKELGRNVYPLERHTHILDGIRWLGTTLWSRIPKPKRSEIRKCLNDYHYISKADSPGSKDTRRLVPEDTHREFLLSKAWLKRELKKPFDGKTVVITHHVPLFELEHPRWQSSPITSAFASNLADIIQDNDITLWMFGHAHDPVDTTLYDTRFVSNPYGYPSESVRRENALTFQITL
ncbi:metallophosphoesterase [Acidithiobacillus sp. M4-SHS-6]|uniref:metallophosphoesterase n=1 Tax=Acidithiobacillus sp. M4-SHS-6 TaxID=3383024 RepID=UPI0039BE1EEF